MQIIPETAVQIADRLGVALYKVRFVIKTRKIQPVGKAGIIRLFDASGANAIESALDEIKQTSRNEAARRGWAGHHERKRAAEQEAVAV